MDTDLKRQIRSLVSARNRINDELKQISLHSQGIYPSKGLRRINRNSSFNRSGLSSRRGYNRETSTQSFDETNAINTEEEGVNGAKPVSNPDLDELAEDNKERPKLDDSVFQGHKRIMAFGLLGYLKKAKNQLDFEDTTEKARRQREVENAVEEKIKVQIDKALEEKKTETLDKLEQVQKELEEKENQLLKIKLIEHYTELSKYIQTKTSPTILWLPKKVNRYTSSLLDESKQLLEEKIEQLEIRFSQPEDVEMEI